MIKRYTPTNDELAVAKLIAEIRNRLNGNQTNIPGGETLSVEERLEQHFRATRAEIATSRMVNLAWTGCGKGSTGLKDVGDFIEVRSIGNPDRGLLIREKDIKNGNDPTALVLVIGNECRLLGWEYTEEVKRSGRPLDPLSAKPAYILSQEKLRKPEELFNLIWFKGGENK